MRVWFRADLPTLSSYFDLFSSRDEFFLEERQNLDHRPEGGFGKRRSLSNLYQPC